MRVIEPSYQILTAIDGKEILKSLESIARTCYKSEDKIEEGSAERMIAMLIKNGHHAMIEFFNINVKFVHNRGFSHEMVRHRLCSFAQESTRYCNYSGDKFGGEITVIKPYWFEEGDKYSKYAWTSTVEDIETVYLNMVEQGLPAQAARGVLPNDLKTEINVGCNLREWRNIFKLRTAKAAHPDMRRVMIPLLQEFKLLIPIIFDDIEVEQ